MPSSGCSSAKYKSNCYACPNKIETSGSRQSVYSFYCRGFLRFAYFVCFGRNDIGKRRKARFGRNDSGKRNGKMTVGKELVEMLLRGTPPLKKASAVCAVTFDTPSSGCSRAQDKSNCYACPNKIETSGSRKERVFVLMQGISPLADARSK